MSEYSTKTHEYHEDFGENLSVLGQFWQTIRIYLLNIQIPHTNPALLFPQIFIALSSESVFFES